MKNRLSSLFNRLSPAYQDSISLTRAAVYDARETE